MGYLNEQTEFTEFTSKQIQDDPILRFFNYRHLPPILQEVSAPFCKLAHAIVTNLPRNAERTVALRKLLEAKDAAVRANVPATAHKETFLDRLYKERADLLGRIEKLNVFIDTLQFFALPQEQQDLMRVQQTAMQQYFDTLNKRIKALEETQPEHVRLDHHRRQTNKDCTCGVEKTPCPVHEASEPMLTGTHHDSPIPFHG